MISGRSDEIHRAEIGFLSIQLDQLKSKISFQILLDGPLTVMLLSI